MLAENQPVVHSAEASHQHTAGSSRFHALIALLEQHDLTDGQFAEAFVARIAAASKSPEAVCLELTLADRVYAMSDFAHCVWRRSAPVGAQDAPAGLLTIGYCADALPPGAELDAEATFVEMCAMLLSQALTSRRLHAQLAEREALLSSILVAFPDIICTLDRQGAIQFINRVPAGFSVESALGQKAVDFVAAEYRDRVNAAITQVFATGQQVSYETEARGPHDTRAWYLTHLAPLVRAGEVQQVLFITRDISEQKATEQQLRASEERYRTIFDASIDAMLLSTPAGAILAANPAACALFGFTEEEFQQVEPYSILDPSDPRVPPAIAPEARTGHFRGELTFICKDGSKFVGMVSATEFRDSSGVAHTSTFLRDVTEQHRAQQALAEQEAVYRKAIAAAGAIAYSKEFATESYTFISAEIEQLTGYSAQELSGTFAQSFVLESIPRGQFAGLSIEEAVTRHRRGEGGGVWECDHLIRNRAGEKQWFTDVSVQIRNEQGMPTGAIGIMQDITARKVGEEALRASEERYRQLAEELERRVQERTAEVRDLYENAPCGYHTVDAAGRFIMVNQTELDWLGYTREEVLGHAVQEFLTPASRQTFQAAFPRLATTGAVQGIEFDLVRKDGTTLPVSLNATATYDADGRLVASRASIFDITARRAVEQALRASEARLHFLLANTPAALYTMSLDQEPAVTFLSDSVQGLLGFAAQQFAAEPDLWWRLIHPDDLPEHRNILPQLLATGSATWDVRARHADGAYRWLALGMVLVRGDAGEPQEIIGYVVDISAQRQATEALRASEARLRSILDHAPASIMEISRDGVLLAANRLMSGIAPAEVIGRHIVQFFPSDLHAGAAEKLRVLFDAPQPVIYESSVTFAPDGTRHFVTYAGPVIIEGEAASAVAVTLDITDMKRMQQEVQAQRDFARQVMDALGQGLVVIDRDLRVEYVNPFMTELMGMEASALSGEQMLALASADESLQMRHQLASLHAGATHRHEMPLRTATGAVVPLLVSVTPHLRGDDVIGYIAVFTDLTEIKAIEDTLRRSRDELQLLNTKLEQAMRLKDEFLASMSHELRTPLTGILGISEALQMQSYGVLNERQFRSVNRIWESGQHLLQLINDILDLSTLEAGQLELEMQRCDVDDICQASKLLVEGLAYKKEQQIDYTIEPTPMELYADPLRVKQMLVNLLSNAVKFTPQQGELGLRVCGDAERGVIRFEVWDKGIGIEAAHLPRLFQPFTQVDGSLSRQYAGTGLGLALVMRMAQLHGGTVDVVSEPGVGSTFTLSLPWQTAAQGAGELADSHLTASPAPPVATGAAPEAVPMNARVLIAEDDEFNAEMLAEYLTFQGLRVEVAFNGLDAVEKAISLHPDVILMDIRMPRLDGFQAIAQIRASADPAVAGIPIIAVTAQAMQGDAERCIAAGANAHVAKPYRFTEVLDAIYAHLPPGASQ